MECKRDLQIKETKEPQQFHKLTTESQNLKDVSEERSKELEGQRSQETQGQDQGNQGNESLDLGVHDHHKEDHVPSATSASLSSLQLEKKESTQNTKHQEKDMEFKKQQEQHSKKMKKKLVGENQERINFLVQASQTLAVTNIPDKKALASQVGSLGTAVGRRCVLRLASSLKRCLCKGCGSTLVYGLNARVRHRSKRQKHLVVTCLTCNTIKRFVSDPNHKLWYEQEEAVV